MANNNGLTFKAAPRISAATFANVLQQFGSPCAPIAQECYDIVVQHNLDPAVALAFFGKESVFGTRGVSVDTKNWGNVRLAFNPARAIGQHPKNFAIYPDWQTGLVDWCERIDQRYIADLGLDTIEKAIPTYAPASENDVDAYIKFVEDHVATWQALEGGGLSPTALTFYRVTNAAGANVREGPGRTFPIARTLVNGAVFGSDVTTVGEKIHGDDRWPHVSDGTGFVSMTLLEVV
jgi:hypothetical protein